MFRQPGTEMLNGAMTNGNGTMGRGLVKRVERLEAVARATNSPYIPLIKFDEKGRPINLPAALAGRPLRVIVMPEAPEEDEQIMATPEDGKRVQMSSDVLR